jgi:hypothetical protein
MLCGSWREFMTNSRRASPEMGDARRRADCSRLRNVSLDARVVSPNLSCRSGFGRHTIHLQSPVEHGDRIRLRIAFV